VRLAFGDFELDLDTPRLWNQGRTVVIPRRALEVLSLLARQRGRVVTRDEVIATVWNGAAVSDASLDQAVKRARSALGDDGAHQRVIHTHRGRGYSFDAPCEVCASERPAPGERYVGREALLVELEAEVERAFQGEGRILLLSGEPGIGKSRTAAELARRAGERGATAWTGQAVELGEAPPYWIWSQVLRRAFSDRRSSPVREEASLLLDAMPELGILRAGDRARPARDASQALFRLAGALATSLFAWSAESPVLIVLDDLHRADLPSLRLLEIVAAELAGARVVFLGTYRDNELRARDGATAVMASIARYGHASSRTIAPLTPEEVSMLVSDAAWGKLDADLVSALHERTGGNPFFLLQLLALGGPRRSLEPADALPAAVRGAILAQVDALEGETRILIDLAAALGREIEPGLLASASGQPVRTVLEHLERAAAAGVLHRTAETPGGRYRFSHALVPETLLVRQDGDSRRDRHRRIADALGKRDDAGARVAEIAEHRIAAALPGRSLEAVAACRAAAADSRRRAALDESARWTRRALELLGREPPDPGLRLALLLELGEACVASAEAENGRHALREAFDLAGRLARPEDAARAALLHAGFEEAPPLDPTRVRLLEWALRLLPPGDHPLRARLLARLAMALLHGDDTGRRARLAGEAHAMAQRLGHEETLGHVLLCVRASAWAPDNLAQRLALDRELRATAERLDDPLLLHDACANLVNDLLESGDLDGVDATLATHRTLARAARQPFFDWYVEHFQVMRALMVGALADAEAGLERAFALGRRSDPQMAPQWYGVQLYGLRRAQGRLAELRPLLVDLIRGAPTPAWRVALAAADLAAGDVRAARAALPLLATPRGLAFPRDHAWLAGTSGLAELCARLDAREEAAAVHEALIPFAGRHVVVGIGMLHLGSVERFLGETATTLGHFDEAEHRLARALAEDRRLGARSSELRTRAARLALLRARGASRSAISEEHRRARAIARRAGLEGELRPARTL